MKTIVVLTVSVVLLPYLSTTAAHAQGPDVLGIFFDESGDQASVETTEPNGIIPFYLVLLEPSHSEGIHFWECILETRTENGPAPLFGWELAGEAINDYQLPWFFVHLSTPLPPAPAVVLASGQVSVADTETEILFYLHPFNPPSMQSDDGYPVTTPLYAYGEELYQPLDWTSGCEAEPVARINDDGEDPFFI